ncbi:hypothetical protein FACS1894122_15790 [Alphaproteobacteria bacterium]|nr:hypothetical protein FACS1894122_15790 [Alphaproteobacteria bacterium]
MSCQGKQSIWFINNRHLIEKIECDVAIDSWANKVNSDEFRRWHAQIMVDFAGNPDGSGIVQDFRDMVISEAERAVAKKHGTLENCINFILEERALYCAFHKNAVIIYPISFSRSLRDICKRYDLNIKQLSYSLSTKLQKQQHKQLHKMHDHSKICEQLMSSLNLALKANIFVIDQYGRYIYKNHGRFIKF